MQSKYTHDNFFVTYLVISSIVKHSMLLKYTIYRQRKLFLGLINAWFKSDVTFEKHFTLPSNALSDLYFPLQHSYFPTPFGTDLLTSSFVFCTSPTGHFLFLTTQIVRLVVLLLPKVLFDIYCALVDSSL